MGNALVVGLVEKMGKKINEIYTMETHEVSK
jgi:DNA (cytosine-5)-methyltransferase 1